MSSRISWPSRSPHFLDSLRTLKSFFVPLLEERGALLDLLAKRYGYLPHELLDLPLDVLGFNFSAAILGIDAERKANKKTKDNPELDADKDKIPTPDEVLSKMGGGKGNKEGWNQL